jgi:glycosyltransferase involved in cell wall biosynthesis
MLGIRQHSRPNRPLVVSLGFLVRRKRPEVIVEALARLDGDVELVFVGSCAPALESELQSLARRLGVAERMRVTGYVDKATYASWLEIAGCAVQLRDIDFGESAGTVHDAIAARVPTITSVSSCRELPPGTVVNVEPSIGPDPLARQLQELLFDTSTRAAMTTSMDQYAEAWTFRDVAERVTEIVESTIPAPSRQFIR